MFVRVRPDTVGFKSEAEPGVVGAGSSLGKEFVAAFAAIGLGEIIKKTVEAAVHQQATFATLNKAVTNAGAANEVHGTTVDNLIKQQALLKGFSVADLAGAFQQLVTVTHSSAEAFDLLSKAQDLARGTGRDLSSSALAIEKAYEGNSTALTRFGIIVPKVTTDVDKLRAAHAAAADAGVTFNASEAAAYTVALRNATAADKLLTAQAALNAEQQRFGGQAAVAATGAAGEYDRLKVSVDQLAVSIGSALLPTITTGITDLAGWVNALTTSTSVQNAARTAGHDLATAFHDVEDVAKTVGPPLADVAKFAYEVVSAIGAPALLVGVATYKALSITAGLAASAQALYAKAVAQGTAAQAVSISTATAASAAASSQAVSESALVLRIQAATAANAELAASYAEAAAAATAAAAAEEGAALRGAGALALGAAGGPVGAAIIGVAALAAGVVYLTGREQSWASENAQVTSGLQDLTTATNNQKTAVGALAQQAAADDAAAALAKVTGALESQISSAQTGISVFGHATEINQQWVDSLGNQIIALGKTDPLLTHNLNLIGDLTKAVGGVANLPPADIQLLINNQDPTATLTSILSGFSQLTGFVASFNSNVRAGAESVYNRILAPGALGGLTEAQVKAAQDAQDDVTGGKTHAILTATARLTITQLQQGIALATSQQADLNQQMADAVQQGADAVQQAVQQAQQNFITIGQSIATDIGTYIDQPLTDAGNALQLQADRIAAIQQSLVARFAGQNALLSQETNQISLRAAQLTLRQRAASVELPGGRALSSDPTVALRELQGLLKTATPAGAFALQQLIDAYQTDVIAVQRAKIAVVSQQPVAQAQASADISLKQAHLRVLQDIANAEKTAATRSIDDWAAQWETKKLTLTKFNTDVAELIHRDVGSLGDIAKLPGGYLLEQQLLGQISGDRLQALAIAQGPQIAGAGFLPTITHPLTALQNEQKQIASIAHSDATTAATILTDSRGILKLIYGATKDKTGLNSLARNAPTRAQLRDALAGVGISG